MRSAAAFAVLAISSLVSGIAVAGGAPQSQIAVTVTVVRPPVPVIKIVDAHNTVASHAARHETASARANSVQQVLVEY